MTILLFYRKTSFLIPGTKSRTKKSVRDLVLGINKIVEAGGDIRVLDRPKTRKLYQNKLYSKMCDFKVILYFF